MGTVLSDSDVIIWLADRYSLAILDNVASIYDIAVDHDRAR